MPRPKRKQVILPEATPVGVLYTTDEIATLMKTTRRTVQRWIREGKLKAVEVGGQYRVRQDALVAFQKEH
jgi:excisionase family DNA binding protein